MAYPEKISFPDKENLRPLTDPDGQVSAQEINAIRDKINKNALFYDVHDDLAALQAKFANPPVGAFAYLKDGSCYRCVSLGWTTDPVTGGGSGVSYFKGYYTSEPAVRTAYPNGQPGWRVMVRVIGGNDKEGLWDEDDQDWVFFDFTTAISKSYVDDQDAATLQAAKAHANSLVGGTVSPTRLNSFILGYDSGLDYDPVAHFTIDGVAKSDSRRRTLAAADVTHDRIDTFVVNLATEQIEVITGVPAENPTEPEVDFEAYLKGPFVLIPAGADAPANTDITVIYAENLGIAGGEWDTSGGAAFDFDNAEDTHSGAKAIKVVGDLIPSQLMGLTAGGDIPVVNAKELQLWIKPITAGGDFHFTIRGKKSNGRTDSEVGPSASTFGFDPQVLTWQKIVYPIDTRLTSITGINIVNEVADFKFFLDDVRLLGGEGTPDASNDYVTREEMDAAIAEAIEGLGDEVKSPIPKAANYIVEATHHDRDIYADSASEIVVTLPKNSTTPIPVNFETHVWWIGAGKVSFNPAIDVTLNIDETELAEIARRYNAVTLKKIATDVWIGVGALKLAEV